MMLEEKNNGSVNNKSFYVVYSFQLPFIKPKIYITFKYMTTWFDYLLYNLLDPCQTGMKIIVALSVKLQNKLAIYSQSKVAAAMSDMF